MTFAGIPVAALDFYEDLEADNSKSFWTAHKQIYEDAVRAPIEALAVELEPEFGAAKLFRPYRDVRFAKDKTPYKTQQGLWFTDSARYVAISAAGLFIAGGYWGTESDQVRRLRLAVGDDVAGGQLEKIISKTRRAGFEIGGEQLSRVPAGFPKDHPRAALLRYKSLTAHQDLGCPPWLSSRQARTEIAKSLRKLAPLADWLATHVGPSDEHRSR
jgi:uncharacterized protein (TIGR02453 family)